MDIEEKIKNALNDFCTRNQIEKDKYLADNRLAIEQGKEIDRYIGEDILENNLRSWISDVDEQTANKLLKLFI